MYGPKRFDRKEDFARCFEATIEYALKEKPDIYLICGDLYDSVVPRNPPRSLMMRHFRALAEKGIKVFLISGHHDTARSLEQGASPLSLYGESGYARFFSDSLQPESSILEKAGLRVQVSGVSFNPNLSVNEDPLASMRFEKPEGDLNIFMLHYPIEGFKGVYSLSEPTVRASHLPSGYQLVAAGHIHRHQKNTFGDIVVLYPGSTERATFLEEGEKKGFMWLELDKSGLVSDEFIETPARELRTIDFNIPSDGDINRILGAQLLKSADPQLILRVKLVGNMSLKLLETYKRPALLSQFQDKYFAVEFDEREMAIEAYEPVEALPRTTPLEELKRHFESIMAKASEQERMELQDAFQKSIAMLQEAGAW
jgi:DNA repair exonuclease SbcCD nuclease subunit